MSEVFLKEQEKSQKKDAIVSLLKRYLSVDQNGIVRFPSEDELNLLKQKLRGRTVPLGGQLVVENIIIEYFRKMDVSDSHIRDILRQII